MGQIKIVYDKGPGYRTRVIDVETGAELTNVSKVEIDITPHEMPIAHIYTICPDLNIRMNAVEEERCPHCGQQTTRYEEDAPPLLIELDQFDAERRH